MTLQRAITGFAVLGVTLMLSVPVGADSITYAGNGYVVTYDPSYVTFDPYNLPHWQWVHGPQDGYTDPFLWVVSEEQGNGPNLPGHPIPSALDPVGATSGSGGGGGGPTILDPFDPSGLLSGSTIPGSGGGDGGFGEGSLGPSPGGPADGNNNPNGPWGTGDPYYENGTGPTYDPKYEETQAVPEPSTFLLLATGLALAGLRQRRRQR